VRRVPGLSQEAGADAMMLQWLLQDFQDVMANSKCTSLQFLLQLRDVLGDAVAKHQQQHKQHKHHQHHQHQQQQMRSIIIINGMQRALAEETLRPTNGNERTKY
jgi:hypothetical protein